MKKITFLSLIFLFAAHLAWAGQKIEVQGTVVATDESPVVGASVVEKGTTNGTVTDHNGVFKLSVSDKSAIIQISFIGYRPVEMGARNINLHDRITLEDDATALSDIVVIGYGTARKTDLTGSIASIKADDINKGAMTSPQEMMLGRVPGLHITPGDGGPGSNPQIRIRGAASLNASNDPLIVIDGIPVSNDAAPGMPNPLSAINPNDIETMNVLKDASATAIYGSRASNGVIIITTKKGALAGDKTSSVKVSYTGNFYVSTNSKEVKTMSPGEYRDFMLDFFPEGTDNGDKLRSLIGNANTKWQDKVFRAGLGTDQNVSVYGRYKTIPFRASVGYTDKNGTIKESNFKRVTGDISLSPTFFKDHLSVNLNAKGVFNKNRFVNSAVINEAAFFDPTQPVHFTKDDGSIDYDKTNGWWNWVRLDNDKDKYVPIQNTFQSPLSRIYENRDRDHVGRFIGNLQLDYKMHFLPELRANVNVGMDISWTDKFFGPKAGSYEAMNDAERPGLGKNTKEDKFRRNQLLEAYLAYANDIGRHRFDVLAGYSWQHFFKSDKSITHVNTTDEVYFDAPRWKTEHYLISFFGRANYSFDSRYLFTFTLRNDGSSRFAKGNRWSLFPSVAFAWNMKQESFLSGNPTLDILKLRLGWGKTGQQEILDNDYPYMPRYVRQTNLSQQYYFNGKYYHPLQPLGYNHNVKWETTETYNVGLDYGFFNGRISGSLDFYFRKTYDLLNTIPIPLGSNFTNMIIANVGNMENKGVEFSISGTPILTKEWRWDIGLNATWQKTKITKLTTTGDKDYGVHIGSPSSGTGTTIQIHKVGYSPYTFFMYQQAYLPNGKPAQNVFVDRDGDGQITEADRYITKKSPEPKVYFGLNSMVSFRNWDFSFSGHGSFGNWMYNDFYASNCTPVGDYFSHGFLKNMAKTVYKSGFTDKNGDNQIGSDMFLENASFFRMDNITLGYTFNNVAKTKLRIRTAFSVQNAFVITNYSGLDPEGLGIDNNIWPRPRIYNLMLSINF